MTENAPAAGCEEHDHEGLVHTHRHFHVTHNHNEMTEGFEHLSAAQEHEHDHDHAPLHHAHVPHQDFEREHAGEAHVNDHDQRRRRDSGPEYPSEWTPGRSPPASGRRSDLREGRHGQSGPPAGRESGGRRQGHAASRVLTGIAVSFSLLTGHFRELPL
jgi:hypothetical protein